MIDRKPLIDHRAIPTLVSGKSAFGRSPTGSGLSSGMQEVESGLAHVSRSGAIWPCAKRPVRSARRRAVGRAHACDRSAQCPLRPWQDRLRHGRRTPSLEPSAGIRFAALHNGLERVAARLKRNPTASKDPFGPPMLFTSAHRGPSIARLDWCDSDPGTSINFWNRISMTDSNFALDAGQS